MGFWLLTRWHRWHGLTGSLTQGGCEISSFIVDSPFCSFTKPNWARCPEKPIILVIFHNLFIKGETSTAVQNGRQHTWNHHNGLHVVSKLQCWFLHQNYMRYFLPLFDFGSELHSKNVLWLFASEEYLIKSTDVDSAAEWDVLWVEAVDAKSFQTLLGKRVVGRQSWETKNCSFLNNMSSRFEWLNFNLAALTCR